MKKKKSGPSFNLKNIVVAQFILFLSAHCHALVVANKDDFTMKFDGRMFIDAAKYTNANDIDFGNDIIFRTLRIGAKGHYHYLDYQAELNYANDQFIARNVTIAFKPSTHWQIKIGQFKPYVSLEELTSSRYINFLERGIINTFVPSRRLGAGVHHFNHFGSNLDYTFSLGGFGSSIGNGSINGGEHSKNINGRSVLMHTLSDNCNSLLGISVSYTDVDSAGKIDYAPRPESGVTNIRLVDTDTINQSKYAILYNLESAIQLGPLSFQGEYMLNKIHRINNSSLSFNGFYFFTSYFLTSDNRILDKKSAAYKRVKPNHQWGAVEFVARLSYVNLDDGDIYGGHERNITVGLNWYWANYFRFMANVIKVNAKKNGIKTTPMIYTVRGQFDFG